MIGQTLLAPVGPDGAWETWFTIDSNDKLEHALGLVEKFPRRWRIA